MVPMMGMIKKAVSIRITGADMVMPAIEDLFVFILNSLFNFFCPVLRRRLSDESLPQGEEK